MPVNFVDCTQNFKQMTSAADAIAERLLQINAVKLNVTDPYTWASGWKSPVYCDNRRALGFPYVRDLVKSELCAVIFEQFSAAENIAAVATAGISWGALAADQLKLPFMYVRPKPKEHGLGNQIEGAWEKGQRVVIIEDLISTGKSSLQVVDVLRNEGLMIEGMISIFDYGFPEAEEAFKNAGVKRHTLSSYHDLIKVVEGKKIFTEEQVLSLREWRQDPANWRRALI